MDVDEEEEDVVDTVELVSLARLVGGGTLEEIVGEELIDVVGSFEVVVVGSFEVVVVESFVVVVS